MKTILTKIFSLADEDFWLGWCHLAMGGMVTLLVLRTVVSVASF